MCSAVERSKALFDAWCDAVSRPLIRCAVRSRTIDGATRACRITAPATGRAISRRPVSSRLFRYAEQQTQQVRCKHGKLRPVHRDFRMYDQVPSLRNLLPAPAHHFSDAPPHAIAHYGVTERLLDAESDARLRQFVRTKENREVGTRAAFSRAINGIEVTGAHQPRGAGKFLSPRYRARIGCRTCNIIRA
jgi:hypothetical protein